MARNYSVTEPHPSVATGAAYIGSGIGGAGNYKHYTLANLTPGPSASGPAARVELTRPHARTVLSGRGGAGNSRRFKANSPEPAVFQFDEELMKQRGTVAPIYHFGRGGGGNFVDERKSSGADRNGSSDADSAASITSDRSTSSSVRRTMEGAFGKLNKVLSKK
ncbi:hypothetical protein LTR08_007654 [Meristemomyces frigidus]|nr:hypothetical protein LTR08_007654 [Meristemomyces frigidus]